ncbi:sigma-70 family RNA polymerase sigma factor [Verrucomicrobiales bacterium]|nr:sigma-70 family RNA polymerase sigma factor [bacterium]MDB4808819.1 sigma-70 family RNA polymerase sigma factor [Verrucomicrobiales bacterium]
MMTKENQLDNERLLRLMEGVTGGDASSFNDLCETVRGILSATIFKVLNNREDSEDVCQEVLAKVWEHSELFDPSRGRPLTWLRTLARNRAIDRLRSKQRRANLNERFRGEVDTPANTVSRDLTDIVSASEQGRIVRGAVIELSLEQQQVLELAYFGGLTQSEIAVRLDQPIGTVKARIRRGVKCLRDRVFPVLSVT